VAGADSIDDCELLRAGGTEAVLGQRAARDRHRLHKQGAGFRYTGERGYQPLLATRSGTGEALHIRQRKG
jgi:hypothetical protein